MRLRYSRRWSEARRSGCSSIGAGGRSGCRGRSPSSYGTAGDRGSTAGPAPIGPAEYADGEGFLPETEADQGVGLTIHLTTEALNLADILRLQLMQDRLLADGVKLGRVNESLRGVGVFGHRHFARLAEEVAEAEQGHNLVFGDGPDDEGTATSDLCRGHVSGHSVDLATYAEDAGRRHDYVVRPHYLEVGGAVRR